VPSLVVAIRAPPRVVEVVVPLFTFFCAFVAAARFVDVVVDDDDGDDLRVDVSSEPRVVVGPTFALSLPPHALASISTVIAPAARTLARMRDLVTAGAYARVETVTTTCGARAP
jgi:hypothetical protein